MCLQDIFAINQQMQSRKDAFLQTHVPKELKSQAKSGEKLESDLQQNPCHLQLS